MNSLQTDKKIDGRKKNGGLRPNAGSKPRTQMPQKSRHVKLTDAEHNYLVFKYGTFAEAVRTLVPVGYEFDDK